MADDPFAAIAQPETAADPFAAIAQPEQQAAPPTPGAMKRLVSNFGQGAGVVTPEQGKNFFLHPIDTAKGMLEAQGELGQRAAKEFKNKDYVRAAQHGIEYLLPGVGPALAHAGDQLESGDIAGGAGTTLGVGASLVADPERVQGGLSKVGQLRKSVAEGIQPVARKVTGVESAVRDSVEKAAGKQTEALADNQVKRLDTAKGNIEQQRAALSDIERDRILANTKAAQDTAKAQQEHAVESQRVAEENKAASQTLDLRRNTEADLKTKTDAYFAKEDAVKAKVKAANDANWDAWRQKVGDAEVDMQPVRDTIDRVSANFPEVKQILKDTAPAEGDLSAANQQYVADRRGLMRNYGYGDDYNALQPERKSQIDDLMDRMGLKPDESGVDIDSAKPLSIQQLHDLKTNIGWKVFRREYPPNVAGAMKQVLKSLDQAEARTSIESGAIDELNAARQSHADFQDAFGRSKPKRALEGELRKKEANPDAYSAKEDESRLAAVAKHDPSLADSYREIQGIRANLKSLPSEDALRKSVKQMPQAPAPVQPKIKDSHVLPESKPLPPIPEAPTVDVNQVAKDAIAKKARNWGSFNARDVGILSSGVVGELMGSIFGNTTLDRAAGAIAGVASYEGGKYALSRTMNKPAVIDWLAKTPKSEIDVLSRIPGADKVKVVEGLTQVAMDSAKYGKPIKLSAGARSLLGPANVARIFAVQAPGARTVNNRKDALELLNK